MSECNSVYMFRDINECNNIIINKGDSDFLATLFTPEDDKNLNDMEYKHFFAALYEAENMHFKIYAYDFVDNKTAKRYFKACAKRECIGNSDCSVYADPKRYVVTGLNSSCAYSLYTEPKYRKAVESYIGRAFSIEMKSVL